MIFFNCIVVVCCHLAPSSRVSLADDWPLERGDPLGTGVARSSLPGELSIAWKKKIGEAVEATAVIADSVIYVGDANGGFHAIRLNDGEAVWSKTFDAGFLSAAAVRDGRVYVGDYDGVFRCLNAIDGAEIWAFNANAEYYAGPNFHGEYVLTTSEDGSLYCLDAKSGEKRWAFSIDAPLRCSPTISGDHAALAGCDARLHVVDVTRGDEVASLDINSQTGSTPAMANGRVFFGVESGAFLCLELSPLKTAWRFADTRRRQPIRSAAAVSDATVIFGGHGKHVYALDPKDGASQWRYAAGSRIESAPVIAGERAFVATTKGLLVALDIATGNESWRFNAGGGFTASPAVADGRLVIGNDDGTLYCFRAETPETAPETSVSAE